MKNLLIINPAIALNNFYIKWRSIPKISWMLYIFSIISLLLFYIFQINSEISERYLIREYEKKLDQLSQENKELTIGLFEKNSFNNLEKELEGFHFEPVGNISYIQVLNNKIVVKERWGIGE